MKYSKEAINKLTNKIDKEKFTSDEKEALKSIISDYNHVFSIAAKYQDYVKRKNAEWAKEMNQNHKLLNENQRLKDQYQAMKEDKACMKKYITDQNRLIRELTNQNKMYEKMCTSEDKEDI